MKLYEHQERAVTQCLEILSTHGVCYLAGEVRTGKTLVALTIGKIMSKPVLFVTKKMAIKGIQKQIEDSGILPAMVTVINYEQLHKISQPKNCLIIIDEAHTVGGFPKPAKRAKMLRMLTVNNPVMLLSGTPSPESFSQLFNQFWATNKGPWAKYRNFYAWAKTYVFVQKKWFSGVPVNDYSHVNMDAVSRDFTPYLVSITQADAGFKGQVSDEIHTIEIAPGVISVIKEIVKTGVHKPLNLVAESAAQKMSYVHQLCSGTVITKDESRLYVDYSKVDYIRLSWGRKKKAIFYCYIAEGELLRHWFPNHTDSPEEFKADPKLDFICQIKAGQEGVDLSSADAIIFYNISYSASSYFQGRARGQKRDSGDKVVHWLFSSYGLEKEIFDLITGDNGKKKFTTAHFRSYVEKVGDQKTSIRRLVSY